MLTTEPMYSKNVSVAKQFGAAFAVTGLGQLIFFILLISAGATFIASEFGAEKLGQIFVVTAILLMAANVVTRFILRRFFVTVLEPDGSAGSGKLHDRVLIQVIGGIVTAVSRGALWGKENMLHLTVPMATGGVHGFPLMMIQEGSLIMSVKYLDFDHHEKSTPIKWQALYDFALLNNNRDVASVSMAIGKRFQDEAQKNYVIWSELMKAYFQGDSAGDMDRLLVRLAQTITEWDLCPCAPIVFSFGIPNIKNKHRSVLV